MTSTLDLSVNIEGSPLAFLALLKGSEIEKLLISIDSVPYPSRSPKGSENTEGGAIPETSILTIDEKSHAWTFGNFGKDSTLSISDWQTMKLGFIDGADSAVINRVIGEFVDNGKGLIRMSPFGLKRKSQEEIEAAAKAAAEKAAE